MDHTHEKASASEDRLFTVDYVPPAPPGSPPDPPSVRIPGYEIAEEIGRGGMGVV
jgi:hypothetical protein